MVDFSKLKSMSGKKSLDTLSAAINKFTAPKESRVDERYWSATVDKAGNGYAVIRFLPSLPEEDSPFVSYFDHGFKGEKSGLWYIENSLTTIGKEDPVSEYNSQLWNSTTDDKSPAREQARKQKRRLHFISNVYIVSDSGNHENEGKVFLFKYGKKIFNKLNEAMHPQFEDETPMNPFDLWKGADFKLKIRNVEGYRNYDKSEFAKPSPLFDNDDELATKISVIYPLAEFVAPAAFKSYDELKSKLVKVLADPASMIATQTKALVSGVSSSPSFPTLSAKNLPEDNAEDDDEMSYFKSLVAN